MKFAFLFYQGMTALDMIGPHEILSRLPGVEALRVAKHAGPIHTDCGVTLTADVGFADVMQADKLVERVTAIGTRIHKPINHRILLNEFPFLKPSASQAHMLRQIEAMGHPCFDNTLHNRPSYGDPQLTGLPLHFDQPTEQAQKAIRELDNLVDEILATMNQQEQKAAA